MTLTERVRSYIDEHRLLTDGEKIVVGLSGGADSMALLSILRSLNYQCIAAHCNFHLRGEESNRDESFVEGYCQYKQIEYTSVSFDTYQYMKDNAISLEMAARELRYKWFEELRIKYGADKIAVAHHQDDSIETILINLIRGCGIRGLTGIPPQNGAIVRPLIKTYRNEILNYLEEEKIPFVNDSTNSEDVYTRNKIRLNIIPSFETINPSVRQSISRMSEYLSDVETVYLSHIQEVKKMVFDGYTIDIEKLEKQVKPKNLLFEILHPYGFNSSTVDTIYAALNGLSGKIFYSDQYRLIKDRKKFILEPVNQCEKGSYTITADKKDVSEPLKLAIHTLKKDKTFLPEKNKKILYADLSKISFPLKIRKWQQGDRFKPLGMNGSKKLSDYFTDRKYSLADKEAAWLLCSANDEIIWIMGERTGNRFKITDNTTEILKIEIL